MGIRNAARTLFGSGSTPAARPSIPSTRELERQRAAKEKAAAASKDRSRRHKFLTARGETDPLEPLD